MKLRPALVVKLGQSNWQGAAKLLAGLMADRHRSLRTGATEPFFGCNNVNQGGSAMPFLIDLLAARGWQVDVIDGTIGGASAFLFTGRSGWTLTGDPAQPAAVGYSSVVSYTGPSSAAVLREGDAGFDPCGLLSRTRSMMASRMATTRYDAVWVLWGQSESDVSYGQAGFYATYRDALLTIGDYMAASGAQRVGYGLSVQFGSTTAAQMQALQLAITEAVAARPWAFKGADLFARWGAAAPLIPEAAPNEATRVHLDLRGQQIHAHLWRDAIVAAGLT